MDDVRLLKYFGLIIPLGISCLATILVPILTLIVASVILASGVFVACYDKAARQAMGGGSRILMVIGVVLILPPTAYITAALVL